MRRQVRKKFSAATQMLSAFCRSIHVSGQSVAPHGFPAAQSAYQRPCNPDDNHMQAWSDHSKSRVQCLEASNNIYKLSHGTLQIWHTAGEAILKATNSP
jgi:hypothetical protein